ncbi:MAG: MarR family transcriptional regulator [Ferruginibacter sp.]
MLYHLWKEDGLSQQQLCDATFRDKPSITRLVDNLEKVKLVKRNASKEDRRINMIVLTDEGSGVGRKMYGDCKQYFKTKRLKA